MHILEPPVVLIPKWSNPGKIEKVQFTTAWGLHFANICIFLGMLQNMCIPPERPLFRRVSRQVSLDLCTPCQTRVPQQLQVPHFPWETDVHLRQGKTLKKWPPGGGTSHGVLLELSAFYPGVFNWKSINFSICLRSYSLVSQPCNGKCLLTDIFQ